MTLVLLCVVSGTSESHSEERSSLDASAKSVQNGTSNKLFWYCSYPEGVRLPRRVGEWPKGLSDRRRRQSAPGDGDGDGLRFKYRHEDIAFASCASNTHGEGEHVISGEFIMLPPPPGAVIFNLASFFSHGAPLTPDTPLFNLLLLFMTTIWGTRPSMRCARDIVTFWRIVYSAASASLRKYTRRLLILDYTLSRAYMPARKSINARNSSISHRTLARSLHRKNRRNSGLGFDSTRVCAYNIYIYEYLIRFSSRRADTTRRRAKKKSVTSADGPPPVWNTRTSCMREVFRCARRVCAWAYDARVKYSSEETLSRSGARG